MNRIFIAGVIFMSCLLCSCKDEKISGTDESECFKVKSVTEYRISEKTLYLIQFFEPTTLATKRKSNVRDSISYLAAVLDLPESFKRRDGIFYMKAHSDPEGERKYHPSICRADFSPDKIPVCNEASAQPSN